MTPVDHLETGLTDLPPQQRKFVMDAIATVVLRQLDVIETVVGQVLDALALYTGDKPRTFLLDYLGQLLGQQRLSGQSDELYRAALQVRVLVRLSCGTLPDISRVAQAISTNFGDGRFDTYSVGPHRIVVVIGSLDPDPTIRALVLQLVLDTIGEVDWLSLLSLPVQPFTFDTTNLGWSQGLWAESVYSSF